MEQTKKVVVVGVGGIGFYLSLALSRAGVQHSCYDTDTLEGGLGFSRMPKASPSTKKTALLRGFTIVSMGDKPPVMVDALFTGVECSEGDLVIDCCDMPLHLRKDMWATAKANGARLLRVSYDGLNNTIVVAEGLPLRGSVKGNYSSVPSLSLSYAAAGVGATAVQKILSGYDGHVEFQITVDDYFPVPRAENVSPTAVEPEMTLPVAAEAPKRRQRRPKKETVRVQTQN